MYKNLISGFVLILNCSICFAAEPMYNEDTSASCLKDLNSTQKKINELKKVSDCAFEGVNECGGKMYGARFPAGMGAMAGIRTGSGVGSVSAACNIANLKQQYPLFFNLFLPTAWASGCLPETKSKTLDLLRQARVEQAKHMDMVGEKWLATERGRNPELDKMSKKIEETVHQAKIKYAGNTTGIYVQKDIQNALWEDDRKTGKKGIFADQLHDPKIQALRNQYYQQIKYIMVNRSSVTSAVGELDFTKNKWGNTGDYRLNSLFEERKNLDKLIEKLSKSTDPKVIADALKFLESASHMVSKTMQPQLQMTAKSFMQNYKGVCFFDYNTPKGFSLMPAAHAASCIVPSSLTKAPPNGVSWRSGRTMSMGRLGFAVGTKVLGAFAFLVDTRDAGKCSDTFDGLWASQDDNCNAIIDSDDPRFYDLLNTLPENKNELSKYLKSKHGLCKAINEIHADRFDTPLDINCSAGSNKNQISFVKTGTRYLITKDENGLIKNVNVNKSSFSSPYTLKYDEFGNPETVDFYPPKIFSSGRIPALNHLISTTKTSSYSFNSEDPKVALDPDLNAIQLSAGLNSDRFAKALMKCRTQDNSSSPQKSSDTPNGTGTTGNPKNNTAPVAK